MSFLSFLFGEGVKGKKGRTVSDDVGISAMMIATRMKKDEGLSVPEAAGPNFSNLGWGNMAQNMSANMAMFKMS
jgi:hypothetical protein